jgi:flagellar hook-associated protein 3 FlgL
MRISTSSIFDANVSQLNTLQGNLFQTQQQVSTGRRILTPADDPAAAALALQVSQTDATNTQYIANIGAAQTATALGEGALQSVTTLLQNIQTTAVQAGNGALANSDRATLASGLQANLAQLVSMANAKDAVGNYLFSGFKGVTQPFIQTANGVQYNGNDGQQLVQVSGSQKIATSDSGANIFMRIKNGNGTFTTGVSQTLSVAGANVMPNATGAGASVLTPIAFNLTPATFTVDGNAVTVNTPVTVPGTGLGPGTLAAAIQAGLAAVPALAAYTVTAAAGGGLQINNNAAPPAPAVQITLANATAISNGIVNGPAVATLNVGTAIVSQGTLANPAPTAAQLGNSYQITFNVTGGTTTYSISGTDVTGAALPAGSLPAPSSGLPYTDGQAITFNGIQFNITGAPANNDTFTVKPSTNESVFTTIQNLINTLNSPVLPSNSATSTQLMAGVNSAINNLGNALNSVVTAQTSQGTRRSQLDALNTSAGIQGVNYKQTLSGLQDLDYNKALSDLSQQQTMLKAAQQSFVHVEGLSMFNYMR